MRAKMKGKTTFTAKQIVKILAKNVTVEGRGLQKKLSVGKIELTGSLEITTFA